MGGIKDLQNLIAASLRTCDSCLQDFACVACALPNALKLVSSVLTCTENQQLINSLSHVKLELSINLSLSVLLKRKKLPEGGNNSTSTKNIAATTHKIKWRGCNNGNTMWELRHSPGKFIDKRYIAYSYSQKRWNAISTVEIVKQLNSATLYKINGTNRRCCSSAVCLAEVRCNVLSIHYGINIS